MFFLAFAGSIRIFTLFLNLGNSEVFLIPAIVLLAIIFAFFQRKPPSGVNAKDFRGDAQDSSLRSEGQDKDKEKKNQIFDEILDETEL